ncbi:hypothetical protein DPMN_068325 [Dreissena polymorpha]|uniref:Fibronectin type-III domain-containing protein n=1 Tax=Dreissena polymorpha TaxID=45954 RepID=A0A9D3Z0Z1_DREPO|nr:hypothetical protein DPMN_068325 [Dreissena polymorpha]
MSWHGFQDHYSGIKYYMVAISNVKEYNSTNISFTNVGLLTDYTFTNLNLKHGDSYSGIVKAVDAAGHESITVFSPAQLIDDSPPKGFICDSTQQLAIDIFYQVNNDDPSVVVNATFIKDNVYYISGSVRSLQYDLFPVLTIDRSSVPLPFEKQHNGAFQYNYTFISQVTGVQSIEIAFGATVKDEMLQNLKVEECTMLSENNSSALSMKQIGPYSVAVSVLIMDAESGIRTVSLGAGTTKGGFQIKRLHQIHNQNNVGVIFAPFAHGTSVYLTAIAENHAGLKTVFHSDPAIIIDHTAPILTDINVAVAVDRNNSVSLHGTWKVKDDESGVQFCKFSVGSTTLTDDIQAEKDSDTLQSFHFDRKYLHHGDKVYVTVTCVNKVELATIVLSNPVTIYLDPPSSAHAFVNFMPVSQESTSMSDSLFGEPVWQSNSNILHMEWDNFEDRSQITSYRYRILSNGEIVVDWMDSGLKNTISNFHLNLMSGQTYNAEVKALNGGDLNSSSIQSSLVLVSEPPALSGLVFVTE